MNFNEQHQRAIDMAKGVKKSSVKDEEPGIPALATLGRGGEIIAYLEVHQHDASIFVPLMRMAIIGFCADTASLVSEGWQARSLTHPVTGQPWAPGGMQKAVEEEDALAKGWVSDTLVVTSVNRAGDVRFSSQFMQVQGRKVRFDELRHASNESNVGGYIPDTLREAMLSTDVATRLATDPFVQSMAQQTLQSTELTHEQRLAHLDVGTTMGLMYNKAPINVALKYERGTAREAIIKRLNSIFETKDL